MPPADKKRADQLLAERGVFDSRSRARQEILAGGVLANGAVVEKPSQLLETDADIVLAKVENPYVSRGGLKLAHALDHFDISLEDQVVLDVGASTGGFTEVLLERGAVKAYALDVGQGQLHPSLQSDDRVVSLERTDIRTVDPKSFDPAPSVAVIDVSFISLRLVLPSVLTVLGQPSTLIALIKPQFEVGKMGIGKGGIVKDKGLVQKVCDDISDWFSEQDGWSVRGIIDSPITGGDGNAEFLIAAHCE